MKFQKQILSKIYSKVLSKLETSLLCKMLLFKEVVIMIKEQIPKLIDAVVNVPVNVNETFDMKLPNHDQC